MDLNELRLFLHLSKTLHFAETSREMNISSSALSRTIKRIEEESGEVLFLRDNRTVTITESGKKFADFAGQVLDSYDNLMEQFLSEDGSLKGTVRIYASVTASYTVLADILTLYRKNYPKVHIDLHTGSASGAIEQVLSGNVDITIAAKPGNFPDSLVFLPLEITPLHFIAPKTGEKFMDLLNQKDIPWEKIPFILADRGVSRQMIDRWFHHNHIKPEVYASVSGNEAIIAMVALGFGVGIVPELVMDKSPMKDDIEIINGAPELEPYTVGLCTSKRLLASPAVRSFWNTAEGSKSGNAAAS